jgi:acetyl esterase/lipase
MSTEDILTKIPPAADARLHYGPDPNQFGDLRLPHSKPPHPILIFIHGGFWRAKYDLSHAGHLCAALAKAGVATWNVEYRRVGNPGGGWPETFTDILQGQRCISQIAARFALDTRRGVVMGHSAGGQLALCLAARQPRLLRGVVSLAGVVDLQRAWELHLSHDAVAGFLGGSPQQVPEHYKEASPMEISLSGVPQWIIHGTNDDTIPFEMSRHYVEVKRKRKEEVHLVEMPNTGHFELIDPTSQAWPRVQDTVKRILA